MSTPQAQEYETILHIVRQWPTERRLILVHEVLKTLVGGDANLPDRPSTLSQARGLLATSQPAPSDDEVARWRDERRREQYDV